MTVKYNMMSLGGYRFLSNRNPYHELNNRKTYNWQSHDRYLDVERLQFKGRKARTMSMNIKVVVEKQSDLNIIPSLKTLGDTGDPLALATYSDFGGEYGGDWVITDITEKHTEFSPDGVPMVQEATLNIKEWVE